VKELASEEEGAPAMAPSPHPPDYTGGAVDSSSTMGWINPAPEMVSHVASTPSTNAHGDDWGGWRATPAAAVTPSLKAENGSDPWDSQQQAYNQDEWDSDFDESEDQQAMPPPS
jgi:hypothetical protein